MALAMAFIAAKRESGLKNQNRLQTVFLRNQPLLQRTGIASPVTCCPAGTLLKLCCCIAVNKSPGLVESCQHDLLRAWEWSQSSALQLPLVLPLRRGGRKKSPFKAGFQVFVHSCVLRLFTGQPASECPRLGRAENPLASVEAAGAVQSFWN